MNGLLAEGDSKKLGGKDRKKGARAPFLRYLLMLRGFCKEAASAHRISGAL